MSVHVQSNVWRSCPQTHDRLLLMVALADYCNDEGYCWPSLVTLARRVRFTKRGLIRMMASLIEEGEFELVKKGGNGAGDKSMYLLARYSEEGVLASFRDDGDRSNKGDRQALEGCAALGQGGSERKNHHKGTVSDADVVNIYNAYPLKKGRPAALRAIKAALKKIDAKTLLERTQAFAAARNGDLAYCPNPATWFNQERFNDDPSTWGRRGADKGADRSRSLNAKNSNADRAGDY